MLLVFVGLFCAADPLEKIKCELEGDECDVASQQPTPPPLHPYSTYRPATAVGMQGQRQ